MEKMQGRSLVSKNENKAIVTRSRQHSAIVTVQMVERAAARRGKELTIGESEDWVELLEREPGPAIRWAFMEHAKESTFFPQPSEILSRIRTWYGMKAQEERRAETEERDRRIAAGEETYGWGDALQEFRKVIDAKTDLTDEQKVILRERLEKIRKSTRKS